MKERNKSVSLSMGAPVNSRTEQRGEYWLPKEHISDLVAQLLISAHRFSFSVGPTLAATVLSVLVMAALGSFGNAFFRASIMPILVRSLPWISALKAGS